MARFVAVGPKARANPAVPARPRVYLRENTQRRGGPLGATARGFAGRIFAAAVDRGCIGEACAVIEHIHHDIAEGRVAVIQESGHVNPAFPAQQKIRRAQAEAVALKPCFVMHRDNEAARRIGQSARVMFPAEGTLACARRCLFRGDAGLVLDRDGAAVAAAVKVMHCLVVPTSRTGST